MTDFDFFLGTNFQPATLTELLRWRAAHQGEQVGYTFISERELDAPGPEAGGPEVTYGEVDRRARAIAARLQSLGARGEPVLLLYPPSAPDYLYGFFGCQYAGSTAIPSYPPQTVQGVLNLQNIMQDSGARLLLTTKAFHALLTPLLAAAPGLEKLHWLYTEMVEEGLADEWQDPLASGDELALLQYTSGTTGLPKGVMLTHANVFHNCSLIAHAYHHTAATRVLTWIPTYHNSGLFGGVIQPLYGAYASLMMSPLSFLQSPPRWLRAIGRYRATVSGGPNFAYDLCVRFATPELLALLDFSTWDTAFTGAEHIRLESLNRFADAFAACGFRREAFFAAYGLTESSLMVSGGPPFTPLVIKSLHGPGLENNRVIDAEPTDPQARSLVSCGQILPDQQALIVNPETLTRCEAGRIGELWLSSGSVSQGYWQRPLETAATFHAYLSTGEGPFLRTGDLGFIEGNHLFITGRIKDLIIIRGRNYYPQDIEATIAQAHPAVKPASAVFSVEVEREERLVVVQEVSEAAADDYDAVLEAIRQAVALEHSLQVHAVALVKEGTIPKTASNKIQRYACRVGFLNNSLQLLNSWQSNLSTERPALPSEQLIENPDDTEDVAAWLAAWLAARVGLENGQVAPSSAVAGYGLDSLGAVELALLIETRLGVNLPMWSLLQGQSINELASQIVGQRASRGETVRPIVPLDGHEAGDHQLSHGQKALWFMQQLAPESSAYNVAAAVRLHSPLDTRALRRSFEKLVERHASLRTTFIEEDGVPLQRVHEQMPLWFIEEDATELSAEQLQARLSELAHRPFDLSAGPLLRLWLFKRGPQEHILLSVVHHIVTDLWSSSILLDELRLLYSAEKNGSSAKLPPVTLQYTDFARWQAELLKGEEGERLWSYWQQQLSDSADALELPTDRPRPPVQTYRGAAQAFKLDAELTRRLKLLGQENGSTLFMTLLAAFQALLHRYTGQRTITVGSPSAGRTRSELTRLVGYLVNPLVLRAELSEGETFISLLEQARQTLLAAFAHQDYPFALLVERLQPERDPAYSPLFQTMFVLQRAQLLDDEGLSAFALGEAGTRMQLGELTLESYPLEQRIAQFDLTLVMAEVDGQLGASFEYNTDLFEPQTIRRMSDHLRELLRSIVADPARAISSLPMLAEDERQRLLGEWSRTASSLSAASSSVQRLFEMQAERRPEAVAVECAGEHVTYSELNGRANRLAHHLRALGVGPETVVGLMVERSPSMLVGLFAILKAGGAYLPLDPSTPTARLNFMLSDSHADLVLTERQAHHKLGPTSLHVLELDTEAGAWAHQAETNPLTEAEAESLAYLIYTSGSTGQPKGVMVSRGALANFVEAARTDYQLTSADRVLQFASLSFDAAAEEIFACLTRGGTLVLRNDAMLGSTARFLQQCREWMLTALDLPTAYWHELTARLGEAGVEIPPSVRLVIIGGEKASPHHFALWRRHVGRRVRLLNTYGPTEAVVAATMCDLTEMPETEPTPTTVPIGRPFGNTEVFILDQRLQPVPVGVPGELYIGGLSLARGYLGRPDLTAEKFIPNPFSSEPGARLYRTGDIARRAPNGNIEFRGRADSQVKLRGFRIELGEIEAALGQHPSVLETVVLAREDERGKRLIAYVVTASNDGATATELRDFLKRALPDYMIPSAFVTLERLPRTINDKLDWRALPMPDELRPETGSLFVVPRTPVEEALAEIWRQALSLNQVGTNDNFFELGGHSLLAAQLVSRTREAFGVELPLRAVFEAPTIARLSHVVEEALKSHEGVRLPPLKPRDKNDGTAPLSFAQQRLWFLQQLAPDSYTYNMPGAVRLRGPLNLLELQQFINRLVERHEALRTTFADYGDEPVQIVHPFMPLSVPVTDLSEFPPELVEAEVERLLIEEAERPFDLTDGPLLRSRILKLGDDDHVLQLTMHHIISDGWSVGVFIRELTTLYEAAASGAEPAFTPLPVQYADFAVWQRQWLRGELLESQLAYWKEQLADSPPLLELPTDRPRPPVQTFRGATHAFTLSLDLTEELKALSRREGVTLFMTLLAGFQTLLSRYSGQQEISVGTSVAGRSQRELEGLIGFFVNTLVLRSDLKGDPDFTELLRRVRETTLAAYAHQDMPFERLVEELQPERSLSHSPLFQVMFVMQSTPVAELRIPGLTLSPREIPLTSAKFDLTLTVEESRQGLVGTFEYNTDLFEPATIARMSEHLRTLLHGLVADPLRPLWAQPLLSDEEQRQVLIEWNDTVTEYDGPACVQRLFEAQAARAPEAVAVVSEDERLTYSELNCRANVLARTLRVAGVGPEVRVAIIMERSVEMVVALWAVLKAGGAYVPLDPHYPHDLLRFMLTDAEAAVVLTQEGLRPSLPLNETSALVLCPETQSAALTETAAEDLPETATADNLAYVIYTSGSTGRPKGVMISHRGLSNYLNWALRAYDVVSGGDAPVHSPLSFDLTITSLLLPLIAGRSVRLLPEDEAIEALARALDTDSGCTLFKLTPTHLQALGQLLSPVALEGAKVFVIGGEALSWQTLAPWLRSQASLRLINEYGPTETVVGCCIYEATSQAHRADENGETIKHQLSSTDFSSDVPIGRPIANTRLYILDEHFQPVPVGVVGELCIGGAGLARGYLNRAGLTAERFIPDPFAQRAGARMYRTGDRARYLPDGCIEFLGRTDEQLKVRGFRIEAGEVEAALRRQKGVRAALVMAREDARGDKQLVAYLVLETEDEPSDEQLRHHLREQLPAHMIPAFIVRLDELPLTPNGKVNRKALPAPEHGRAGRQTEYVAPQTEVERALAEIWQELLNVERAGVEDNFFELGGHSLLATRLVSRIRAALQVDLALRTVFERPTISELAQDIETIRWAREELIDSSVLSQGQREFGEL